MPTVTASAARERPAGFTLVELCASMVLAVLMLVALHGTLRSSVQARKEAERQLGQVDESKPDALLVCDKQRHGEWEGRVALWFEPESLSYRGEQHRGFSRGYDFSPRQTEPGAAG